MPSTTERRRAWRDDLQGLRVVAIFLVAAYHVWTDRVSGGVDVFLMLSGFFVGGSLLRRFIANDPPRVGQYLARHARRLVPTAAVVLAATAVAFVAIVPSPRWASGSWETIASLLYVENWYLATAGQAYGAADVDTSPWQHFWSMSVQGQFFLITPLLLAALWLLVRKRDETTRRRALIVGVTVMSVASMVLASWLVSVDQTLAYYHTGARVWEFFAGILLAALLNAWRPSGRMWDLASWAGLITLVLSGVFVDGLNTFPGPWALVPVGAAAVLVVAGANRSSSWGATRLLSWKWVSSGGKYAYAFYLWHWPLLILFTTWRGYPSGWKVGIAVLIVSAVLAVATHHLVEAPLVVREGGVRMRRRFFAAPVATACTVAVVVASSAWLSVVAAKRADAHAAGLAEYPGAMSVIDPVAYGDPPLLDPIPSAELAASDTSQVLADGCVTSNKETELKSCSYVDGDGLRVALFGASHSEHWFEVALQLATENDWTLVPYIRAACPPTLPQDAGDPACAEWLTSAYDAMEHGQFDLIITTATRPHPTMGEIMPSSFQGMLEKLSKHSAVLGIRDNPNFERSMPDCYAAGEDCEVPLYDRIKRVSPTDGVEIDRVAFVDVNDLICPDELCRPVVGNRMVFRDTSHLTTSYVESMAGEVARRWLTAISTVVPDAAPH